MPQATKTIAPATFAPATFDPQSVSLFGDLYTRWFENVFKISQGIAEVTQDRIQKNSAAWTKLISCRDPKELAECQRNLTEELTVHLAEDMLKVSRMIASVAGPAPTL